MSIRPSRVSRSVDERLTAGRLREIGLHDLGTPARRTHAPGGLFRFVARPGVAEHHIDAARGQLAGDHEADAFAAGDQRNLVW